MPAAPEPLITRDRTWVFFTDATGMEWEGTDARRRPDGSLVSCYPSTPEAVRRYFVRYGPFFAGRRAPVERMRYCFRAGESRWFDAQQWQAQLRAATRQLPSAGGRQEGA